MEKNILEILKQKNICTTTGQPRKNRLAVFQRVEKLIKLHPDDPVWCEGVARTAFRPNTQHSSFLDACQERGIVDENYVPVDEETYQELRDQWEDLPYESVPLKRVEQFMDEVLNKFKAPDPIFHGDDDECW